MKKTTKMLALALVIFMLISATAFSSFAGFAFWKEPAVESAVFTDSRSISLKELETYYTESEEILKEYDTVFDEFPSFLYFDLNFSAFDYGIELTMNDGKKVAVSTKEDYYVELGNVYTAEINAYISYDEYLRVSESGADTVNVTLVFPVYNSLFGYYTEEEYKEYTVEKSLTDCFVKSITEISGVPSEICADSNYYEIDEAEFLVEYDDGSNESYAVEVNFGKYFPVYKLNGVELDVYEFDGKLCLKYYDGYFEKDVIYIESPFESIEITECIFDGKGEMVIPESVTYKIKWKDGREENYTHIPSYNGEVYLSEVIGRVNGFNVELNVMPFEITEDGGINSDKIVVTVSVGNELSGTYTIDSPYAGAINAFTSVVDFFSRIISFFRNVISYILNIFSVA